MSRFDAPLAANPSIPNDGVTNGREILAYVVAQMLKLVVIYTLSFARVLNPLYVWAMQSGGRLALYALTAGLSVAWGALTLAVFFAGRALMGGVPTNVPRGPEVGLFALAYAIVIGVQLVLGAAILSQFYVALGAKLAPLLGLGVSLLFAAIVFAVFIGMRRAIRIGAAG